MCICARVYVIERLILKAMFPFQQQNCNFNLPDILVVLEIKVVVLYSG